jgi:hypothetical protein
MREVRERGTSDGEGDEDGIGFRNQEISQASASR